MILSCFFDLSRKNYSGYATLVSKAENSITLKGWLDYRSYNIAIPNWQDLLGKTITISCKFKKSGDYLKAGIRLIEFRNNAASTASTPINAIQPEGQLTTREGTLTATATITKLPNTETYPNAQYCLGIYSNCAAAPSNDEAANETITYWDIQVEIGDVTTEYEPYVGKMFSPSVEYPQKISGVDVSINCDEIVYEAGIKLHGIDDFCDGLVIDRIGSVITKTERVELKKVKDLIVGRTAELIASDMGNAVYISGICKGKEGTKSYCTHFKECSGNYSLPSFELLNNAYSSDLYFYGVKQSNIDDFITWLDENNVMIAYVLDEPRKTVIEAPQLLKIKTPYGEDCTVRVESYIKPKGLNVIYYSLEGEV